MQKPELHHDEKPEKASGSLGDKEILQYVPEAHRAQRGEISSGATGKSWGRDIKSAQSGGMKTPNPSAQTRPAPQVKGE